MTRLQQLLKLELPPCVSSYIFWYKVAVVTGLGIAVMGFNWRRWAGISRISRYSDAKHCSNYEWSDSCGCFSIRLRLYNDKD